MYYHSNHVDESTLCQLLRLCRNRLPLAGSGATLQHLLPQCIFNDTEIAAFLIHDLLKILKAVPEITDLALVEGLGIGNTLLHVEAGTDINQHRLCRGECAGNVERTRQRDEQGLVCYQHSVHLTDGKPDRNRKKRIAQKSNARDVEEHGIDEQPVDGVNVPSVFKPSEMLLMQSLNLDCAVRRLWKDSVRCCSSSSSCFLTWANCWVLSEASSTGHGLDQHTHLEAANPPNYAGEDAMQPTCLAAATATGARHFETSTESGGGMGY
jgi:hypothetical protein